MGLPQSPERRQCLGWLGCAVAGATLLPGCASLDAPAALALQAQAGCPVTFSRSTATVERGIYQVVVEYSEEDVGRLALTLAEQLCIAARDDQPFDLDGALAFFALLGLSEIRRMENEKGRFTLVYLAAPDDVPLNLVAAITAILIEFALLAGALIRRESIAYQVAATANFYRQPLCFVPRLDRATDQPFESNVRY